MKEVDPVEELHEIRQRICKKAGGTPADYFRYYLEMDREKVAALKTAGAAKPVKANPATANAAENRPSPPRRLPPAPSCTD